MNHPRPTLPALIVAVAALGFACSCQSEREDESTDAGEETTSVLDGSTTPHSDGSLPDVPAQEVTTTAEVSGDGEVSAEIEAGEEPSGLCESTYAEPTAVYNLPGTELLEISGMVASRTHPGVFWAHNDSGDQPHLLAFNETGVVMDLQVQGVDAVDWEELARAPCPISDGDCLWIADMGNNLKNRETLEVIVVAEPDPATALVQERQAEVVYRFSYPDDTMDAEAFVVAVDGSRFFVIEKVDSDVARVFSSPSTLTDEGTMTLIELTTMVSPGEPVPYGKMMTAADLHPSGARLVVRCYTGTWEYRFEEGQGPEHLGEMAPTFVALGPLEEPQGEALAYGASGDEIYTASEDPTLQGSQPLHRYVCED